eukprot:15077-Chlamydomonas_euryale.AAC.1
MEHFLPSTEQPLRPRPDHARHVAVLVQSLRRLGQPDRFLRRVCADEHDQHSAHRSHANLLGHRFPVVLRRHR